MIFLWKILYNFIIIPLLWISIIITSLFSLKIRASIKGRTDLFNNLKKTIFSLRKNGKLIWIHSASMGEFEQAKPVISMLKEKIPDVKIVASFFSPSGYLNNLNYKIADYITYIPFDSFFAARKFINILAPDIAIFIRYDIWPNIIWSLAAKQIPIFLIDATMKENSKRSLPIIKGFHINIFKHFKSILAISQDDANGFSLFNCKYPFVKVVGDTRYDQVFLKSMVAKEKKILPDEVVKGKRIFIVGSSWIDDEKHFIPAFIELDKEISNLLMILVPHEPTENNLDDIEDELRGNTSFIRFSQLLHYKNEKVIIIDCIGLLLSLYSYGNVAYVGGGFGEGIHNILEPATYGIPVLFGHRIQNSQEALKLVKIGAGFIIKNKVDVYNYLKRFFSDEEFRNTCGTLAGEFVRSNVGATQKIFNHLDNHFSS